MDYFICMYTLSTILLNKRPLMDEDFEQLLKVLLNSHELEYNIPSTNDKRTSFTLSPKQIDAIREGLHWYMGVIPMITLIPNSKIVLLIETERTLAQEWLSRSWQYKRYHIPNVSQLPLEDDLSQTSTLSNESSFDMYWDFILLHCKNTQPPSLAILDVVFYLFITFATSTGSFSDPTALRIDAQKRLCQFIQTVLIFSGSITPHFSLFMRTIIQYNPGNLSLLDLTILEQYVLQGIMNATSDEKKLAAISLYQSIKKLQGVNM